MKTIASWFFNKNEEENVITEQFVPGVGSGYAPATSVISAPPIPPPLFIPNKMKKSNQELVKEIHEKVDWYALYVKDIDSQKIQDQIDAVQTIHDTTLNKIKLRSSLGFALSEKQKQEQSTAESEITALESKISILKQERDEREILNNLRIKYPQRKFIHMDDLLEVCSKYNLALGYTKDYIGDIPDKNLFEIRDYKKLDETILIFDKIIEDWDRNGRRQRKESTVIDVPHWYPVDTTERDNETYYTYHNYGGSSVQIVERLISKDSNRFKKEGDKWFKIPDEYTIVNTLVIACPSQDLKKKLNDVTVTEIQDPIVLCPVGNKNVFEVVTKWGNEAKEFVNPIHN